MKRYAAHIHFCVDRRRESFKRSLQFFGIEDPEPGMMNGSTEYAGRIGGEVCHLLLHTLVVIYQKISTAYKILQEKTKQLR